MTKVGDYPPMFRIGVDGWLMLFGLLAVIVPWLTGMWYIVRWAVRLIV